MDRIKLLKKSAATLLVTSVYYLTMGKVWANPLEANVNFPSNQGINPNTQSVGGLIGQVIRIIFILGGLLVLVFLIIGAFQWITSGGDKEKVGKARGTIVHALIGMALLALAYFMVVVFGKILNIDLLNFTVIPTLNEITP